MEESENVELGAIVENLDAVSYNVKLKEGFISDVKSLELAHIISRLQIVESKVDSLIEALTNKQ